MATLWCMPCGADGRNVPATVEVDGDPMCAPCADYMQRCIVAEGGQPLPQRALSLAPTPTFVPEPAPAPAAPAAPAPEMCRCGKPARHRGSCPGEDRGDGAWKKANAARHRAAVEGMSADVEKVLAKAPRFDLRAARQLHAMPPKRRGLMDTLVAEVVRDEDVPAESEPVRKSGGRMGEIWEQLDRLQPGFSLKVVNRDRHHLRMTLKNLRESAKKRSKPLVIRAVDQLLYVRYAREGEAA